MPKKRLSKKLEKPIKGKGKKKGLYKRLPSPSR